MQLRQPCARALCAAVWMRGCLRVAASAACGRVAQVRTLVQQEMGAALQRCDVLVCPTAPTPAYKVGEKTSDPLEMYKGDVMTVNLNLAGLPAVVVPCGFAQGGEGGQQLPVGLQIIGRMFGEAQLLRVAHAFEQTACIAGARRPAVCAGAAEAAGKQLAAV